MTTLVRCPCSLPLPLAAKGRPWLLILAFNGDLESRLALHWLVHECGHEVIHLVDQPWPGIYLEPLRRIGPRAGRRRRASVDRSAELFPAGFRASRVQADAVYEAICFLGSALARYVIARELIHCRPREGCVYVAHSAASAGNDQVRLEPPSPGRHRTQSWRPVREWNLTTSTTNSSTPGAPAAHRGS